MHGSLAERLRMLRAREDWGLVKASERLGINRQTLRDLEQGKREPYGPTLRRLAQGYGVSMADLLSDEELPPKAVAPPSAPLSEGEEERREEVSQLVRAFRSTRRVTEMLTRSELLDSDLAEEFAKSVDELFFVGLKRFKALNPEMRDSSETGLVELEESMLAMLSRVVELVEAAEEREENPERRAKLHELSSRLGQAAA